MTQLRLSISGVTAETTRFHNSHALVHFLETEFTMFPDILPIAAKIKETDVRIDAMVVLDYNPETHKVALSVVN